MGPHWQWWRQQCCARPAEERAGDPSSQPFWLVGLLSLAVILRNGGDSSAVQDELRGVQQIHAAMSAFAAILRDVVQHQLKDARQIQSSFLAFAAIPCDEVCCDQGPAATALMRDIG